MPETIIQLKNLSKTYNGTNIVIDNVNLEIKKGEFVTILGPSGCGKTTIMRMLGGFETPTAGQILLYGKDISNIPANRRPINTVFQNYALFPHMNIYENIAFGLKLRKMSKEDIDAKVKKVLEIVDLEGFEKRNINTLSGGQRQRVAIARAIVNEPEILLLDEPLAALDYKMRKEMQLELKKMHQQLGITFIFVTHDQEEALTMSDKIVILSDGKIQQAGSPKAIYDEPANAFVADFIGVSNIYNGQMTGKLKVTFCDHEFTCVDDYPAGTKIEAVVRPEDVILTSPEEGQVTGQVTESTFQGDYYEIVILSGKNEIIAKSLKNIPLGTTVGMIIEPDGIHVMLYNLHKNHFRGVIEDSHHIRFIDNLLACDLTKVFKNTAYNKEDELHTIGGDPVDLREREVDAYFNPSEAFLTDVAENGTIQGTIASIIYKGDHYSYLVRSSHGVDYYIDDEYLWNIGDFVGVMIPEDKITYQLAKNEKGEAHEE